MCIVQDCLFPAVAAPAKPLRCRVYCDATASETETETLPSSPVIPSRVDCVLRQLPSDVTVA